MLSLNCVLRAASIQRVLLSNSSDFITCLPTPVAAGLLRHCRGQLHDARCLGLSVPQCTMRSITTLTLWTACPLMDLHAFSECSTQCECSANLMA
eukprot:2658456-Amphidinium_carterae.1